LCIDQVEALDNGYVISFDWTKTIQFREQQLWVVLPQLPHHPLCPTSALIRLLSLHDIIGSCSQMPLLCERVVKPLSYTKFISFINSILAKIGLDIKLTGHSFRRGGTTWAFRSGLSGEIIQNLGMWKSDAYHRYIDTDLNDKIKAIHKFGAMLPKRTL